MKLIPANEAKLPELLEMLEQNPTEEIFLTNSDKPKFRISRIDAGTPVNGILPRELAFGYAKGKHKLPDDFDEAFVAMDAEILKMFAEGADR